MARFRKPFFRATRGLWYVWHGRKQINLGSDKDAAFTAFYELKANPEPKLVTAAEAAKLVAVVIDDFLDFVEKHRSPHTYRWYKDRLQLFLNTISVDLTVDQLKPFHVQKWIDGYPDLSSGSKRNYCRSIQRAMNWAEEQGYVMRSPLAHFRKPSAGRKEQVVTPAEYQKLLEGADENFKDLLTATWETGCRPQESLRVEARHADLEGGRWFFPASESKGKKKPRVVYLTPKALEITRRLTEKHPTGPLFRNADGAPWTTDAVNCRFQRIKKREGVKYSLYALRHSFATHALMKGLDSITVATLLGHADPSTLARTYQHLSQNPIFLHEQLQRAIG